MSDESIINPTIRLLLKSGVIPQREVAITGLPIDLTEKEAEKITKILEAMIEEKTTKMDEFELKEKILEMSQEEMARIWRFAPSDSPYVSGEIGSYFKKIFEEKGGMTPKISKQLGW